MVTFWYKLRLHQAWKFKAPLIMSAIYLVIFAGGGTIDVTYILLSFSTIIGIAGIGYLTNDFGDRATDAKAGKPNIFNDHHPWATVPATLLTGCLAFVPWLYFPADHVSLLLLGAEILAFILYGVPPFRLKKSILLAPFLDTMYAHVIPVFLAAYTFMLIGKNIDSTLLSLLVAWQFLFGIRAFINHLFIDRSNDIMNYPTLATKSNAHDWRYLLVTISALELIVFLAIAWLYSPPWVSILMLTIGVAGISGSISFYSFRSNWTDQIYIVIWPLIILLLSSLENSLFWLVLVVHLLLFPGAFENKWSGILVGKCRQWMSFLINHFIYFFRRFVLWQSDQTARREYYTAHQIDLKNRKKMKENGAITLVNLNKDKYSETFVNHYKTELPYGVDFLHGGYPPFLDEQNNSLGGTTELHIHRALAKRLQKTRSRLILAHFGPMAVSMIPVAQLSGVPMVAYFHAYDIHHEQQIAAYRDQYRELFKCAHLLLASSQEIAEKLVNMGAAQSKVKYLPAFFPVTRFLNLERDPKPMKVLAIGRFADTKSPHILLLAFAKVVEAVPSARLVVIGEGELLESSMMLTEALKLKDHVTFTGQQSPDQVLEHLSTAHLFVQHSATTPINKDREGTPVAVMEAMSAGLPVISTRHAGIQELITSDENGILVEELDYEAMAEKIIECLKSADLCERLGRAAKERIKNNPLIMDHMKIITQIIEDYGLII